MKFESLEIESEKWGADKGKLIAKISVSGKKSSTRMQLPEDVGEKILQLAKEAIIDAVEQSANEFIYELTTFIPQTMRIETNLTDDE